MASRDAPNATIPTSNLRSEMEHAFMWGQAQPQRTTNLQCHRQRDLRHHLHVGNFYHRQQKVDCSESPDNFDPTHGNAAHPSTTMSMERIFHTRAQRNEHSSGSQSTPMAATTPPTSTSRAVMSQKRQNIMQRRIEIRRRNEERQKQLQQQRQEQGRQPQHQDEQSSRQIGSQSNHDYQQEENHPSVHNDDRRVDHRFIRPSQRVINSNQSQSHKMQQNIMSSFRIDSKKEIDHFQQRNHLQRLNSNSHFQHSNPIHNKITNQESAPLNIAAGGAGQQITQTKSRGNEQKIQERSHVVSPAGEYQSNNFKRFPPTDPKLNRQYFNSLKYQEQNGPYHNEFPSPIVPSPPTLQRRQHNHNYYSNPGRASHGNYHSEQHLIDEGGPSSDQLSPNWASRIVSPHESPSDEGFGIRGVKRRSWGMGVSASTRNQHQHYQDNDDYDEEQVIHRSGKQIDLDSLGNLVPMEQNFQSNQQYQNQQTQQQPNWHEINRQHMYQKQLAVRQQRLQCDQPQCVPNQPHQHNQSAPAPGQGPLRNNVPYFQRRDHPSYFSPVEALDKRNDQIQRKTKMTIKKPNSVMNRSNPNSHRTKPSQENHGNPEEDPTSVSDTARKYLDAHDHVMEGPQHETVDPHCNGASSSNHLHIPRMYTRSNSSIHGNAVPNEASRRLIGQSPLKYSQQLNSERAPQKTAQSSLYPSLLDEETVSGSVASLKKEWEERAAKNYLNDSSQHCNQNTKNFNGMSEGNTDHSINLGRRGQRKDIVEKLRRKDVRSLPPERRNHRDNIERTGEFCHGLDRVHHDGYQSDGPSRGGSTRSPYHRSNESDDATPLSVKDARLRLWDQNEKLRAWLPKSGSFESTVDVRNRSTGNSASPGDMSGSAGSALFKSKFVHAAAVAAKKRANFDPVPINNSDGISKYPIAKSAAVSSHVTDSTAETTAITTPAGSNGSSYRTQSNLARGQDHSKLSVHQELEPNEYLDENCNLPNYGTTNPPLKSSNTIPEEIDDEVDFDLLHHSRQPQIAPPIDERPRSSCGGISQHNGKGLISAAEKTLSEQRTNRSHSRASSPVRRPLGKDFFREHSTNTDQGKMHDGVDDPEQDSLLSSDDSTVSSMTNPTYQSISDKSKNPAINSMLAKSQRMLPRRSLVSSHERAHNTERQSPILPPQYKTKGGKSTKSSNESNRGELLSKQEYADTSNSSHENKIPAPSGEVSDNCISENKECSIGGSSTRRTSTHKQYSPEIREHSLNEELGPFGSDWESVPRSTFFSNAREKFEKADNREGGKIDSLTTKEKGWHNQCSESKNARGKSITSSFTQQAHSHTRHTSFPESDDDRFSLLPHVISDAFSNVDISLDEAPRTLTSIKPNDSISIEGPQSSLQTISQAFSDVDISLEHMKTVKQRKKELESLSKSLVNKASNDSTIGTKNGTKPEEKCTPTWLNQDVRKDASGNCTSKPKKMMEPKLRLKGNVKLTQKFARLMKAFEDDH
ncbi:hypothetical protein ACHAXS_008330 [Conticribra weissflogii]